MYCGLSCRTQGDSHEKINSWVSLLFYMGMVPRLAAIIIRKITPTMPERNTLLIKNKTQTAVINILNLHILIMT